MSTSPPRPPLSRERIVRAALALIDARGLDRLTMRRLGAELGVEAMSLYKHVAGKEAILDGVRELLLAEFAAALPPEAAGGDWCEHLERFAHAYRALGRAHPEAFGLLARGVERAYVAGGDITEAGIRRLLAAGFDRETAIRALRTVVRYVLGSALVDHAADDAHPPVSADDLDQISADHPLVGHLMRSLGSGAADEALFDFGLAALLHGLRAMAPETP